MIAAWLALLLQASILQAPTPVVERFVTVGPRTTRLSLFDNRVAVLSVREGGERALFRKRTLDEQTFAAYVSAVTDAHRAVSADRESSSGRSVGTGTVLLYGSNDEPATLHYAPGTVLDLATGRLVDVLDDLEAQLLATPESWDELQSWQPQRGDVVELYTGDLATVRDVSDDDVVVLRRLRSGLVEYVPREAWARVIRRLVPEQR